MQKSFNRHCWCPKPRNPEKCNKNLTLSCLPTKHKRLKQKTKTKKTKTEKQKNEKNKNKNALFKGTTQNVPTKMKHSLRRFVYFDLRTTTQQLQYQTLHTQLNTYYSMAAFAFSKASILTQIMALHSVAVLSHSPRHCTKAN